MILLNKKAQDLLLTDTILFGKVCDVLKVKVDYLPRLIRKNDPRLTQASVVKLMVEHAGCAESELLTEKIEA